MKDDYQPQFKKQMSEDTESNLQQDAPVNNSNNYEAPGVSAAPPEHKYVTYIPYGFTPQTYKEKRDIRKIAFIIGLSLVIMLGITLVWGTAYVFIMQNFGYSTQQAYDAISEPAVMQVLQIVLSTLMFTIPFIIVYKSNGYRVSDLIPLSPPKKESELPLFLFGISFCAFANIAVSQASTIFQRFGINYEVDFGDNPEGFFGFILSFLASAVVPPLIEEFACRGLILGSLRKFGDGFALLVSSILFGLMHGNFEQMPFAFLVGLVLGYIVIKSGSLWIAIAVHAFNNFISVFFTYFLNNINGNAQNAIYAVFLAVCILLGVIAVMMLTGKDEGLYSFEKSELVSTERQKMKWFFSSVFIIIFIVICVVESFAYFI